MLSRANGLERICALLFVSTIGALFTASALGYPGECMKLGPVTCGDLVFCAAPPCATWKDPGQVTRCSGLYVGSGFTECEDDPTPTMCGGTGTCNLVPDPFRQGFFTCTPGGGVGWQSATGQGYAFDAAPCP